MTADSRPKLSHLDFTSNAESWPELHLEDWDERRDVANEHADSALSRKMAVKQETGPPRPNCSLPAFAIGRQTRITETCLLSCGNVQYSRH